MPVERRLATDMQPLEASLQQRDARMQGRRIVRAGVDATRQPLEPACPDIVNGKIRRYPESGKVLGRDRRAGLKPGVELV